MADDFDLILIGMGVAGEEIAGHTAKAGLKVLGIERKLVGGECPYWGCIPSKIMVRAGDSLAEAARVMGLAGEATISPSWAPVAEKIRGATDSWDDQVAVDRHMKERGGGFVRGAATIVGPNEVEVDGDRYRARRGLVIATGQEPAIPPIDGLADVDHWTNREAIEAKEVPSSMVVLGGGPIGLEIAQTFHRFGTEITIVEMADRVLPNEEPENGDAMAEVLRAEGMTVHTGVAARRVQTRGDRIVVDLDDGTTVEGERLLVATGRRTNLGSLGVDALGLDPEASALEVDENLRVVDGVWAAGDVTGKGAFTHVGVYQGRIAAADILGEEHPTADYSAVPRVTFTDPEVGSVGLTEATARAAGRSITTVVKPTAHTARGWIHGPGAEHGVIKLVIDDTDEAIIGGSAMGPAAGEIVGLLTLAVRKRVTVDEIRQMIFPYPTFVRGVADAVGDLF